jgi:hypothetical protein
MEHRHNLSYVRASEVGPRSPHIQVSLDGYPCAQLLDVRDRCWAIDFYCDIAGLVSTWNHYYQY